MLWTMRNYVDKISYTVVSWPIHSSLFHFHVIGYDALYLSRTSVIHQQLPWILDKLNQLTPAPSSCVHPLFSSLTLCSFPRLKSNQMVINISAAIFAVLLYFVKHRSPCVHKYTSVGEKESYLPECFSI